MRPLAVAAALALVALLLAPGVAAHHPGSTQGLARYTAADVEHLVHRLPDVDRKFDAWESEFPGLVDRLSAGTTFSGFPLHAIRVTDESVDGAGSGLSTGEKLVVYLDGGHHGNEFLGVDLVMYYLEDLLQRAADEDNATLEYLKQTEVYALPIVNVDGNTLDTRKNIRQVDPNRNYDYQWGGPGAGSMITDLNYRGEAPFSEPEVRANAEFATELHPDLWITMHTGIAEFYWPWGWTHTPPPDNAFFTSLEGPFENATNGRVDAMQAAALYLAAGATDDWGYAVLGVPTFTYEVHEDQFVPLYGDPIPDVIADQLAGLRFMANNVRHLGGWLEPTITEDGLLLVNEGWGAAWNITVDFKGADPVTIERIDPSDEELVPVPEGATDVTLSYQMLRIESSKIRTHTMGIEDGSRPNADEAAPAPAIVVLLTVLATALVALRRRA